MSFNRYARRKDTSHDEIVGALRGALTIGFSDCVRCLQTKLWTDFYPRAGRNKSVTSFCKDCHRRTGKAFAPAARNPCVVCGKGFVKKSRNGRDQKACSMACAMRLRDSNGSRNSRWSESNGRACAVCGAGFRAYTSAAKYCSKSCFDKAKNKGMSSLKKLERNSRAAVAWRKAIFVRDNFTCQLCGVRGGKLNADHIKPWALYPNLRYELSNGRTLCFPCHKKTPTFGYNKIYSMRAAA